LLTANWDAPWNLMLPSLKPQLVTPMKAFWRGGTGRRRKRVRVRVRGWGF
jgi:hypothetical protein